MWLPNRVYEALPTIYTVIGLLCLTGAFYIYSYYNLAPMYFMVGVISVLAGLVISQRRLQKRRTNQHSEPGQQV